MELLEAIVFPIEGDPAHRDYPIPTKIASTTCLLLFIPSDRLTQRQFTTSVLSVPPRCSIRRAPG